MKNYHSHTFRCHHATGSDEEYVINAINAGYSEIGFSDHAPMIFPKTSDYVSNFRMLPDKAPGYVQSVQLLKESYADRINIKLGFELEYYPRLFDEEMKFLYSLGGVEYLILGQHYVGNEFDYYRGSFYSGNRTSIKDRLTRYVDQCIEGLKTGVFTYLCHPDLIWFTGDRTFYLREMSRLCLEVKDLGYPIEYNLLGLMENRHYPNDDFWRIASKVGNDVVIGLDAHDPNMYNQDILVYRARMYLQSLGITPLENINLINPFGA